MNRLSQVIRRRRETSRQERELARAFRTAPGSDMRSELVNLVNSTR